MTNTCVVCEYGWILKGKIDNDRSDIGTTHLTDAAVVRRWNNGKGIGGIAKKENKNEYILDPIGEVFIQRSKVLFTIPCER